MQYAVPLVAYAQDEFAQVNGKNVRVDGNQRFCTGLKSVKLCIDIAAARVQM